jgi:hypothetical protein
VTGTVQRTSVQRVSASECMGRWSIRVGAQRFRRGAGQYAAARGRVKTRRPTFRRRRKALVSVAHGGLL